MKFVLLSVAALLEVWADFLFKSKSPVAGIILYAVGSTFWFGFLKDETLGKAVLLFMIVNCIAALGLGHLFLGERLSDVQMLGVGLGLASLWLLW